MVDLYGRSVGDFSIRLFDLESHVMWLAYPRVNNPKRSLNDFYDLALQASHHNFLYSVWPRSVLISMGGDYTRTWEPRGKAHWEALWTLVIVVIVPYNGALWKNSVSPLNCYSGKNCHISMWQVSVFKIIFCLLFKVKMIF